MGRLLIALASRDPAHKIVGALEARGNCAHRTRTPASWQAWVARR